MNQDYVTPVNHSGFSAAATTTAGAAGGAVKTGLKSAAIWIGAFTLLGIGVGLAIATGGLGFGTLLGSVGTAATASTEAIAGSGFLGFITSGITWGVGLGALGGGLLGIGTSWIPGGAGAIVGGLKGGAKASARVENERAAAQDIQTQIAMTRAQAYEPAVTTNVYAANDNKYNFPQQGSAMNPAMASVQLDGAQLNGTAVGQQRAAAL